MEFEIISPKFGKHIVHVDKDDFDLIKDRLMCIVKRRYKYYVQITISKGEYYLLHRYLLNPDKGVLVDHVDGNGLNCQRSNMRVATYFENGRNRGNTKRNKSGFKGVFWYPNLKKWRVQISVERKAIKGGYFSDVIEAARKYNELALKYHGEFAYLNIVK